MLRTQVKASSAATVSAMFMQALLLYGFVCYKRFRLIHGKRSDDENCEQSHQTQESESITEWYRSIRSYQPAGRVDDYPVRNQVAKPLQAIHQMVRL